MVKWGYFPTCDDNKIGPSTDFNSYWFSFALNLEIFADAIHASTNGELIKIYFCIIHFYNILYSLFDFRLKLRSRDTRLREMSTKSVV
ncbi:hypothetical protein V1477_006060 [Vespula maculifrons]|uniref:Uncharacterized protein n=1 Tax=Vespula maculifrons TaxID=7453 RepID=A0ABD2CLH8_VESMC